MIDKFGRIQIKIYNESDNPLPEYQNKGDAGMDIRANEEVVIRAFGWRKIKTGLYIIIPFGYEGKMRSRSGLAAKHGIQVLNTPGTIDSGYRDELMVILINHGQYAYKVEKGDRIAQLVIASVVHSELDAVPSLQDYMLFDKEDRGGGFGSTGVK